MKRLQLSLNQTQKLRLQKALEKLESFSSNVNFSAAVAVADTIPVNLDDGVLKYEPYIYSLSPFSPSLELIMLCAMKFEMGFFLTWE